MKKSKLDDDCVVECEVAQPFDPPECTLADAPPEVREAMEMALLTIPVFAKLARDIGREEALKEAENMVHMGVLRLLWDGKTLSYEVAKVKFISVDGRAVPDGWKPTHQ